MLNALQIHLTDECNLACPYCFNSRRTDHYLSAGDILASINALFGKREIDFYLHFIGGEPLLRWNEIRKVLREVWLKRDFIPNHSLTTNGKNLSAQLIREFKVLNTKITLSIEGRKERHQALRIPYSDSEYQTLLQNARLLIDETGQNSVVARMTLYNGFWDVTEEVEFLIRLGICQFKILPDLNIDTSHCIKALKKLHDRFSQQIKAGSISIFPLDDQLSAVKKTACGVGENIICVAPDGNYYPCHRFVYREELIIGNIKNGLNQEALNTWASGMESLRSVCRKCAFSEKCNFPCPYPDPEKVSINWCNWMKGLTEYNA